jgi:hypothetical protein
MDQVSFVNRVPSVPPRMMILPGSTSVQANEATEGAFSILISLHLFYWGLYYSTVGLAIIGLGALPPLEPEIPP